MFSVSNNNNAWIGASSSEAADCDAWSKARFLSSEVQHRGAAPGVSFSKAPQDAPPPTSSDADVEPSSANRRPTFAAAAAASTKGHFTILPTARTPVRTRNVYVARLPTTFTDDSLRAMLAPYGNVLSSRVFVKGSRVAHAGRAYRFGLFESPAEAEKAVEALNGMMLDNHLLEAKLSNDCVIRKKRSTESAPPSQGNPTATTTLAPELQPPQQRAGAPPSVSSQQVSSSSSPPPSPPQHVAGPLFFFAQTATAPQTVLPHGAPSQQPVDQHPFAAVSNTATFVYGPTFAAETFDQAPPPFSNAWPPTSHAVPQQTAAPPFFSSTFFTSLPSYSPLQQPQALPPPPPTIVYHGSPWVVPAGPPPPAVTAAASGFLPPPPQPMPTSYPPYGNHYHFHHHHHHHHHQHQFHHQDLYPLPGGFLGAASSYGQLPTQTGNFPSIQPHQQHPPPYTPVRIILPRSSNPSL